MHAVYAGRSHAMCMPNARKSTGSSPQAGHLKLAVEREDCGEQLQHYCAPAARAHSALKPHGVITPACQAQRTSSSGAVPAEQQPWLP